jgi:hypothetical protein
MANHTYDSGEDIKAQNIISRWALIGVMSGDAFSTALRDAAMLNMGDGVIEIDGLQYDTTGQSIQEGDDDTPVALLVSIERRV